MSRSACFLLLLLSPHWVSASFPRAQNITWKSTNFKTFLTWEPRPSADYSYTVELSESGGDKQRIPECIRSRSTSCDLSLTLIDPWACYTADVLSEPPLGVTTDLTEFPHSSAPRFCPTSDTDIGRPDFRMEQNQNRSITLYIVDPPTALFKDGYQLTLRDVFSDNLVYRVTYRKNKSSGKKVVDSKSSMVHLTGLDLKDSYCCSVQVFISSRKTNQLGEMSQTICSNSTDWSIVRDYSPGVIAASVLVVLLVTGVLITLTVVCCRRRRDGGRGRARGPKNRRITA